MTGRENGEIVHNIDPTSVYVHNGNVADEDEIISAQLRTF